MIRENVSEFCRSIYRNYLAKTYSHKGNDEIWYKHNF